MVLAINVVSFFLTLLIAIFWMLLREKDYPFWRGLGYIMLGAGCTLLITLPVMYLISTL